MSHFAAPRHDAASMGTVGVKVDVVRGLAVKEAHAKIIDEHGRTLAKNDNVKSIDDTLTLDAQPLQFEALASLQGPLKLEIREPGRLYGSTVASCTLPLDAVLLPFEADVELPLQPKGTLKATIYFADRRPLYGLDLRAAAARGRDDVPAVVAACCACLDALPPSKQRGLYRVPGDNAEVSRVRDALDASRTFEDASQVVQSAEPSVVASALKLYLKELTPALLRCSSRAYAAFTASQSPSKLRDAVKLLPPHAHSTTKHLFAHLRRVADQSDENKMTPGNLGVCFGPTLCHGDDDLSSMDAHNAIVQGLVEHFASVFAPEVDAFDAHFDALATGDTLDKDGFESLAYALGCFPAVYTEAFADLPRRCEDGRVSRDECRAWWARRQRETPPPLSAASYMMVAFFLNYDERRAGVLDDAGFAGLYQGLLDAGYDLGSLEDLLAEMGGTSFRDFVGWFEGLCAAADDGVDELCAAAESVAM